MHKTAIFVTLLFASSTYLSSQTTSPNLEKIYYDYSLDYFPNIKAFKGLDAQIIPYTYTGEFREGLEFIANRLKPDTYRFTRLSGWTMHTSGTSPTVLRDHAMWLSITVDAGGKALEVMISRGYTDADKSLEMELAHQLSKAEIRPALLAGKAVSVRLYYLIDRL